MKDTFYITTAIDYTNAPPHIGHAYEKVLADAIARFQRARGRKVFFLTGVDQHGQKVKQAAEKEGIGPQEFADRVTEKFLELWRRLGISNDGWAATTDERHKKTVRKILQRLHDQGLLYKAPHSGYYSVRQEQFLTDKERDAEGNFGAEWGEVVFLEEENWYFRLRDQQEWLTEFLKSHPDFVTPGFRQADVIHAVGRMASDLSISRPKARLEWGIEFPFDPNFVTYVWFDALINYLSFAGYLAEDDDTLPGFEHLWPADAHVIGKDILVPAHGVYWPCMLRGMGFPDERMPRLLVHGWWLKGSKISKSEGNVVDPNDLADRFGVDALRYYLLRDMVVGQDAEFSEERLIMRYNGELANGLGNLLNRSLSMALRYSEGVLRGKPSAPQDVRDLMDAGRRAHGEWARAMESMQVHSALEAAIGVVHAANAFVETSAPWKLAKDPGESQRLDSVLRVLAESVRLAATLLNPVIPDAAERIFAQLGSGPACDGDATLPADHVLGAPQPVFPRIETA